MSRPRALGVKKTVVFVKKAVLAMAIAGICLSGCGSSSQSFVTATSVSEVANVTRSLSGTVFLGEPVPGVLVEVKDLQGRVLSSDKTDDSGRFLFLAPTLPSRFEVVARIGDVEFSSLLDTDDKSPDLFTVVNIPSTILSRYRRMYPEQTELEAKSWLRGVFADKDAIDWAGFIDESSRFSFSRLGFFAVAAENGGVDATLLSLVEGKELQTENQSSGSNSSMFELDSEDLVASLTGLEPELLPLAESLRTGIDRDVLA